MDELEMVVKGAYLEGKSTTPNVVKQLPGFAQEHRPTTMSAQSHQVVFAPSRMHASGVLETGLREHSGRAKLPVDEQVRMLRRHCQVVGWKRAFVPKARL